MGNRSSNRTHNRSNEANNAGVYNNRVLLSSNNSGKANDKINIVYNKLQQNCRDHVRCSELQRQYECERLRQQQQQQQLQQRRYQQQQQRHQQHNGNDYLQAHGHPCLLYQQLEQNVVDQQQQQHQEQQHHQQHQQQQQHGTSDNDNNSSLDGLRSNSFLSSSAFTFVRSGPPTKKRDEEAERQSYLKNDPSKIGSQTSSSSSSSSPTSPSSLPTPSLLLTQSPSSYRHPTYMGSHKLNLTRSIHSKQHIFVGTADSIYRKDNISNNNTTTANNNNNNNSNNRNNNNNTADKHALSRLDQHPLHAMKDPLSSPAELPVLLSSQYELQSASRQALEHAKVISTDNGGRDDDEPIPDDKEGGVGRLGSYGDEVRGQLNVTPKMKSNSSWKMKNKKKIRTNPWIAPATPPSSPDAPHGVSDPTHHSRSDVLKKSVLQETYSLVRTGAAETKVASFMSRSGEIGSEQTSKEGPTKTEEDANSGSEGYYSSSFGSLSGYSLGSPGSSPSKVKRLVSDPCNDSGVFSVLSSYTGGRPPLMSAGVIGHPRGSESEEDDAEGTSRHSSDDDVDMLLPCSKDLIAINRLLRYQQLLKQQVTTQPANSLASVAADADAAGDASGADSTAAGTSCGITSRDDVIASEAIDRGRGDPFEADDVFDESSMEKTLTSSSGSASDLEDTVCSKSRTLEEIQAGIEASYDELSAQGTKMTTTMNRLRDDDKVREEELRMMRMMRAASIDKKRIFLLQTIQRLKHCLDQQKSWLQKAYDDILEKKWPALHQVKG